jgi:hypothetical protein
MANCFRLILLLSLILAKARAQEMVTGIVVDSASFASLANVNIQLKNTYRGTISDNKGNFSIRATDRDTLVFTRVGYHKLELPLFGYEAGLIPMQEKEIVLAPIIIHDDRIYANPYEGMFDEQRENLRRRVPFYYSKARKDKVKAGYWREEAQQVQTYVDVVIHDPETKNGLMKKFGLTEKEYYEILTAFNEQHYQVMYFLTRAELISLLNKFFQAKTG